MNASLKITLAIPLHNEEENVGEILRRTGDVLRATPSGPHELVLVDDGSTDRTLEILRAARVPEVDLLVLSLSRNFGHQAALSAALDHSQGDVVILMDGDLQDPPEILPTFLEFYRNGYDVVYAMRSRRKGVWYRKLSYFLFYRLLESMSNIHLPLDSGDFSLLSRRVVDAINAMPERHRYLRGLRSWAGFRQIGIPVSRPDRSRGTSKYTLSKLFHLAFDGIFSFSVIPLRVASILGGLTILGSLAFALYSLYARFVLNESPKGFTALILTITFVSGVQLFFLGVIGEYVGRIHSEVQGRPQYIVSQVIRRSGV